jgi:tRNA nucleotidyltransferase (CCA-adding enzyme)
LIRVLHNLSFVEDPTRILRAVRLEQRLGFKIEARTAQLIGDALDMLHRVSGERVRHELDLIFQESEPDKSMARLRDLGVLHAIFPRLDLTDWHAAKFRTARAGDYPPLTFLGLLTYHLNQSEASEFATRLRLSNTSKETLQQLLALRAEVAAPLGADALAPSAIYRLLEEYADAALAIFAIATDDARVRERVDLFRTRLRGITPELTGDDLKRIGIPPGPAYRQILSRLREARLDGEITSRVEEECLVNQSIGQLGDQAISQSGD